MPEGKALFSPIEHRLPAEQTDKEYPFILTTGATIWHWPSGTMTRRSKNLNRDSPTGWLEINTENFYKPHFTKSTLLNQIDL